MDNEEEIIDLTQSYSYCRARVPVTGFVIDLDDSISRFHYLNRKNDNPPATTVTPAAPAAPARIPEVICIDADLPVVNVSSESTPKKPQGTKKRRKMKTSCVQTTPNKKRRSIESIFGPCPICRDPLGISPMASTSCGHVYCLSCITKSLKFVKKCPTCRKALNGAKSIITLHP